jgi:acyl dehydratase
MTYSDIHHFHARPAAGRIESDEPMTTPRPVMGRWFEDLTPGVVIDHAITRTITEADNTFFSVMTMNPAALHLDRSFAETTEFGQRLVNSMLTLSLLIGLSVYETTHGTTVANLGFEEVAFPSPVFHGDTIRARTEVISARASASRPAQGIVVFEHLAFNQHDELVARCRRSALMNRRPS